MTEQEQWAHHTKVIEGFTEVMKALTGIVKILHMQNQLLLELKAKSDTKENWPEEVNASG